MNGLRRPLLVVALILAFSVAGLWAGSDEPVRHPEVEDPATTGACDVCHTEVTPEVVQAWKTGKHGANNVKCFICHGSTGEDFIAEPANQDRCVGCHADHVASMESPAMQAKTCVSCHPAHLLDPHLSRADETEGGES